MKQITKNIASLFLFISLFGYANPILESGMKSGKEIVTGADNFKAYLPLLKNKKVGIVTNQTGILTNKKHLVDFLVEKKMKIKTNLPAVHRFRGNSQAGENV